MNLHFSDELDEQLFIELLFIFMLMSMVNIIGNMIIGYDFVINYKWFVALIFTGIAFVDCSQKKHYMFWKLLIFTLATFFLIPAAFFVLGGLNILLMPYIICTAVVVSFITYGKQRLFMVTSLFIVSIGLFAIQVMDHPFLNIDIEPLVNAEEVLRDMPLQLFITMAFCTYIAIRFSNVWRQEHQTLKIYSQQLENQNDKLEWLATHDELTTVYNRRYLANQYDELKKRSNSHLLILDIDNFKHVNDHYGHKTGDRLLIDAAMLFLETVGEKGAVIRLGGDEFVLLFFDCDTESIQTMLAQLRHKISTLIISDDYVTTLSGGIVKIDPEKSLSDNLIKADQLLYKAKNIGKQTIVTPAESTL